MTDLDRLWEPIDIGPVTVPNRVFVSAHETHHGDNRRMTERYVAYVAARARGGAGLVMPGGASVHPHGEHTGHLPIWGKECIPDYGKLAQAVHETDSKVFVQLFHRGLQDVGTDRLEDWHPLPAPSALASPVYGRVAKPMDDEEIADTVRHYGLAAANMRDAGIDGIELSAGHGYLICQFLSPLTNHRTDRYGGSLVNRARFLREIVEEIRRQVGADYPVGMRMSFDELVGDAGITPERAEEILAHVHAWGLIDFVNVSGVNYHSLAYLTFSMSAGFGVQFAPNAERAKRVVENQIPVMVASGVRTIEQAIEVVAGGQADLVGMTRAHIADPEIVNKARAGRAREIRRCIGVNQGCIRRVVFQDKLSCTINPVAGREQRWSPDALSPASAPLSVLVIGGGPAGMKAAETAARQGHRVQLHERAAALGGQLRYAARLPGRSNWLDFIEDLTTQLDILGVDIRTGTPASAETIAAEGADAVLLATGSTFDRSGFSMNTPLRDGIPGAGLDHVVDPVQALDDLGGVGSEVVIVDDLGDTIALTLAILLAEDGRKVEIVTTQLHASPQTLLTMDFPWLYPRAMRAGVRVSAQSYVEEIESERVRLASIWGTGETRTVAANTVVLCMLRRSRDELHQALAQSGIAATRIGDCLAPRDVDDAVYEGMQAGLAPAIGERAGHAEPLGAATGQSG
jgi:2,4-dienoyl-CoA reductase-like NADH-dependent reductase (Old Yellow Enzyme family)